MCIGRETGGMLQKCDHFLAWCLDAISLNAETANEGAMMTCHKLQKIPKIWSTMEPSGLLCRKKEGRDFVHLFWYVGPGLSLSVLPTTHFVFSFRFVDS
jgi:hypothetical protein